MWLYFPLFVDRDSFFRHLFQFPFLFCIWFIRAFSVVFDYAHFHSSAHTQRTRLDRISLALLILTTSNLPSFWCFWLDFKADDWHTTSELEFIIEGSLVQLFPAPRLSYHGHHKPQHRPKKANFICSTVTARIIIYIEKESHRSALSYVSIQIRKVSDGFQQPRSLYIKGTFWHWSHLLK